MSFFDETGLSDDAARQMAMMGDKTNAQDDKLIVRFYMGTIRNDSASQAQGRPVFDDFEKVRILKPGDKDYLDKGSNPGYRERFPKQYAAFKAGEEEKTSGTPLSMWPVVKASQVAELAHFHVRTVEQLAEMPDVHLQKFMGGQSLRQAAREYVARAVTQAPLLAVQAELADRDAKISVMQAQMSQMSDIMRGLQAQQRPLPEVTAPEGAVPYRGRDFPVAEAAPVPFSPPLAAAEGSAVAPRKRGRPAKSATAP